MSVPKDSFCILMHSYLLSHVQKKKDGQKKRWSSFPICFVVTSFKMLQLLIYLT